MSEKHYITKLTIRGSVIADYDLATFTCTINGFGPTGPAAKEDARPKIELLLECIKALEAEGMKLEENSVVPSYNVQPVHNYDRENSRQVLTGYSTTYTLTFSTSSVEMCSSIHDKLTEVEDVIANSPNYSVKSLADLHKKALRQARNRLDARFADECEVMGLKPDDYVIDEYSATYDESEGSGEEGLQMFAMAASAPRAGSARRAPVQVSGGVAMVTVTLRASYRARFPEGGWR